MRSIISKYGISLDDVTKESTYAVKEITPRYEYVDNKRTDKLIGYVYSVITLKSLDLLNVLVECTKPIMSISEFESLRENGEMLYIRIMDAKLKVYFNSHANEVQDSIRATKIERVFEAEM